VDISGVPIVNPEIRSFTVAQAGLMAEVVSDLSSRNMLNSGYFCDIALLDHVLKKLG
jgi:hypothetical protein